MKLRFLSTLALTLAAVAVMAAPRVATTIDFLDYVFYDLADGHDYYPLEVWEKRLKDLSEQGVEKLYFRVNVCGLTLYPSNVSAIYGEENGRHWTPEEIAPARRLDKTLQSYDPLQETIRLGKKYGMEVWAWESLWDDGAPWAYLSGNEHPEDAARYGNYPLMDPWFRKHPEGYSMRDPRTLPAPEQVAAINREARKSPVTRIVITGETARPHTPRINRENLEIYTSADNRSFTRYTGDFAVTPFVTEAGRPGVEISGVSLAGPYVKLLHAPLPADDAFAIIVDSARNRDCRLFDADGGEIRATWCQTFKPEDAATAVLDFNQFSRFGWDYGDYQLGFVIGEPEEIPAGNRYFLGVCEFAIPVVMEHKVARFAELTDYDFAGFLFNLRSHGDVDTPEEYGFNPEIREQFRKQYGVDIWTEDFDRAALNELRSDALDEFLARCRKLTDGRPLFFTATANGPKQPEAYYNMVRWAKGFGVNWHFDKWFEHGSIDGIMMIGDYFPEEFIGKTSNGKPVEIGVFREMAFTAKNYDFAPDMKRLFADDRIDEIELYEALELTNRPQLMKTVKELK